MENEIRKKTRTIRTYTFYAELKGFEPKIWRRFQINAKRTMSDFASAVLVMFRMQFEYPYSIIEERDENLNMNRFIENIKRNKRVQDLWKKFNNDKSKNAVIYSTHEDVDKSIFNDKEKYYVDYDKISVDNVTDNTNWKATLHYDEKNAWEVLISLESVDDVEWNKTKLLRVIDGECYGIIENVGGVDGLADFVDIYNEGKGRAYSDFCEKYDFEEFDIRKFDIKLINKELDDL
ncbi:MAG: plasmid pRiA4b ORF-3 family protein [Christensenellaceae bacterium]|jgi:hypothetical protein|nr:plasmid pRiA4b ORF-3 family protein [Christensenellaceae bacterium]